MKLRLASSAENHSRWRAVPWLGLVFSTMVLSACTGSLPSIAPKSRLVSTLVPVGTPTLSPLLLTPVATSTHEQGVGTATPVLDLSHAKPTCVATPKWGLGDVWANEPVRTRLGCPVAAQVGVAGAKLRFEHGVMLWRPETGLIYVLTQGDPEGRWGAFADTFGTTDPLSDPSIVAPTPVAGAATVLAQPTGRFGKIWRQNPVLRNQLGWAVVPENARADGGMPFQGAAQDFAHGVILWDSVGSYVMRTDDMSWTRY